MHRMEPDPADLAAAPAASAESSAAPTAAPELPSSIAPMRAGAGTLGRLGVDDWTFEMDWRGDRVTAYLVAGTARVFGTDGTDLTGQHPGIAAALRAATDGPLGEGGVLDGVLVGGRTLVLFDLMRVGRRSLLREPYAARRQVLSELLDEHVDGVLQVPPGFDGEPDAALQSARDLGLDGVVAKKSTSTYQPGRTARTWLRITA